MVAKISSAGAGSARGLVNYLEKQEKGNWFNHEKENVGPMEVTSAIDNNKRNLGKDDMKFYHVVISPSEKELKHIKSDPEKLREYTRAVMEKYAEGFNKSIQSKDLVWYAKIENDRDYKHLDQAVRLGDARKGAKKSGLNTHVHIIVSRTENLERFKELKLSGEIDRKHPLKLSPATNHQSTEKGAVKGGFSRTEFIQQSEKQFDKQFNYQRALTETFEHAKVLANGSSEEKVKARIEAYKELMEKSGKENKIQISQEHKKEPTKEKDFGIEM